MSTHNIDFYEDLTKIIFLLSSNTHLISSADAQLNMKFKLLMNIIIARINKIFIFNSPKPVIYPAHKGDSHFSEIKIAGNFGP